MKRCLSHVDGYVTFINFSMINNLQNASNASNYEIETGLEERHCHFVQMEFMCKKKRSEYTDTSTSVTFDM